MTTDDNQVEKDALWELHEAEEAVEWRRDALKAIAETYGKVSSAITTRLEKRDPPAPGLEFKPFRNDLDLPARLPPYEELQEAIGAFDEARERRHDAWLEVVALGIAPRWSP